jgi:hypothetical protein
MRKLGDAYREFKQREREFDELLHPEWFYPPKPKPGRQSLTRIQIKWAIAFYENLLDTDPPPHHWTKVEHASKYVTVNCLRLDERSWQTVKAKVVRPVLEQRGLLKKQRKK